MCSVWFDVCSLAWTIQKLMQCLLCMVKLKVTVSAVCLLYIFFSYHLLYWAFCWYILIINFKFVFFTYLASSSRLIYDMLSVIMLPLVCCISLGIYSVTFKVVKYTIDSCAVSGLWLLPLSIHRLTVT